MDKEAENFTNEQQKCKEKYPWISIQQQRH